MAKLLDQQALGERPVPQAGTGIARYRAEIPDAETQGALMRATGAEIMGAADQLFAAYKAEQAKVDTLRAEDAYTQLRNKQMEMTYGPGGYATLQGQNAVMGPDIKARQAAFQDAAKQISEGLSNDEQKRLFAQRAMIANTEFSEGFLRHQLKERNVWAGEVTNNGVAGEIAAIAAEYSNPSVDLAAAENRTSASIIRIRGLINAHADDLGLSGASVDKTMRELTDKIITAKLIARASWDPIGAFEDFRKHQTEISDPNHRTLLHNQLSQKAIPAQAGIGAQENFDRTLRENTPPVSERGTFQNVVGSLLKREGGYVSKDGKSGAPANFGINQRANPDVDVAKLTREGAVKIYRERYWNAIGGDNLAPATALVALDTAALQGVAVAKKLLETTGGDPQAMIAERRKQLQALAASDPEQAKYLQGWMNRLDSLSAEASSMPAGVRAAGMVTGQMTAQTNREPTAKELGNMLPISLSQIEKDADRIWGTDKRNPDRIAGVKLLHDELKRVYAEREGMVRKQQEVAQNALGNMILTAALGGPGGAQGDTTQAGGAGAPVPTLITSQTQLVRDPQAAAMWDQLDFDGKNRIITLMEVVANRAEKGNAGLANELFMDIARGKIDWWAQILDRPDAKTLNASQLQMLRGELSRTPLEGGRTMTASLANIQREVAGVFQSDLRLTGINKELAMRATDLWRTDALKIVDQYVKSGKSREDFAKLFDPRDPNYLASPRRLEAARIEASGVATNAEALAAMARSGAAGQPAIAPPAVLPSSIKTKAEREAWEKTLPPEVKQVIMPNGKTYDIVGRQQAVPAADTGFNPEGSGYDYATARAAGMGPTGTGENQGHWGSVAPASAEDKTKYGLPQDSYVVLKGKTHETFDKAVAGEQERGSKVVKLGDRYYSVPQNWEPKTAAALQQPAAVKPAVPPKSKGDIPTFVKSRDPEREKMHQEAFVAAIKSIPGGLGTAILEAGFALPNMTRQFFELVSELPARNRKVNARAGFEYLLTKDTFSENDVPVIEAAMKYGELSYDQRKKAKKMLEAAGG